jgi:hypothetical protein
MKLDLQQSRPVTAHPRPAPCAWGLGAVILCLWAPGAFAQTPRLEWHRESGGGAVAATGGPYELHSTLFLSDGGRSAGGLYRLEGGFLPVALQQQGFPPLSLAITDTSPIADRFEFVWSGEERLILQEGITSAGGLTWVDVSNAMTKVNGTNRVSVVVPDTVPTRIYKLRRP